MKDPRIEKKVFIRRCQFAKILCIATCCLLIFRAGMLQIGQHERFKTLSENNRLALVPLPPKRGLILDRNGVVLSENKPAYNLVLVPEQVSDIPNTITRLKAFIELNDDAESFTQMLKRHRAFEAIPIKMMLSEEEVAKFSLHKHEFTGLSIQAHLIRHYPHHELFAHALGYVGRISESDLDTLTKDYAGTHFIGKNGIEKQYETLLLGHAGYQQVETDAMGRHHHVVKEVLSIPGENIRTSLDFRIQKRAAELLENKKGAVVVMAIGTGEILALVSTPSFDPNPFVKGIQQKPYQALMQTGALYNRAIRGLYPPGSTVKPFIGLGAITDNYIKPTETFFDSGKFSIKGDKNFRGWKKNGHGHTDLRKALKESCDGYYYNLAQMMGVDKMHDWLTLFGFGDKVGIDIPGEAAGLIPSTAWKRRAKNEKWFLGETIITGIGQGYCLVTPVQMAYAASILALGGKTDSPHLVVRQENAFAPLPVSEKHLKIVHDGMHAVIHEPGGTAFQYCRGIKYDFAGKTGTSQVFGLKEDEEYDATKIAKHLHDHSVFLGFAPSSQPKYAVSVILENEKGAAGVARNVMDVVMEIDRAN